MSDSHVLHDRANGLEAAFFAKHNHELAVRLKEKVALESAVKGLSEATGVDEQETLEELVRLGVTAQSLLALSLVPLVQVAWADGHVDAGEREALLKAADSAGIEPSTPAYELLEGWLGEAPGEAMVKAWEDYVQALCASSSAGSKEALRAVTMDRAEGVAKAAGGFLGLGSVSASERKVLNRLAKAFE